MPRWLQKRRRRWYAVLEIPQAVRARFGKTRFVASLETESLTVAERRVLPIIAEWKKAIDLAKHGHSDLASEIEQWRNYKVSYKKAGLSDAEIADIMLDVASDLHPDQSQASNVYEVLTGSKLLLVEHLEGFIATQTLEPKSIDMKRTDILRFIEKFTFAQDVTKRAVMLWVEEELVGHQKLALTSCRRIISNIRSYWSYLERYKELELADPFLGVVPAASKKKTKQEIRDKRKAFSVADYQRLLTSVKNQDQDLGDLIRLGAYTGCRIEELCGLKMENVLADRLKIEDSKTEAGWREVPIHPHIQKLVERLAAGRKDGYFLAGLTSNKYGDKSNAIGKRFGRLKTKCGYGRDYVFHSLRKGVATQLEGAQVPENHVARLLGHKLNTMSYGLYSGGLPIEILKEAVSHLNWDKQN